MSAKKPASSVDLRRFVLEALRPALPSSWSFYDYSTGLDALTSTTVVLTLQSVSKLPAAPQSQRLVTYTLSVIHPSTNPETREDSLDDDLVDLLAAIDDVPNLTWTEAIRGTSGPNLGYDISVTIPYRKS